MPFVSEDLMDTTWKKMAASDPEYLLGLQQGHRESQKPLSMFLSFKAVDFGEDAGGVLLWVFHVVMEAFQQAEPRPKRVSRRQIEDMLTIAESSDLLGADLEEGMPTSEPHALRYVVDDRTSMTPITGECFCGTIRYEITGTLRDARSCHCSRCRKAFSAQASAYALVDPDQFRWLAGEEQLSTYTGGQGFGLRFCRTCGSTLCGTFEGRVHGVTLGCVDGDPGIEIGYHLFTGSKASWEVLPEGIVAFEAGPNSPN